MLITIKHRYGHVLHMIESDADLRGAYLRDADLRGAYLSDADGVEVSDGETHD